MLDCEYVFIFFVNCNASVIVRLHQDSFFQINTRCQNFIGSLYTWHGLIIEVECQQKVPSNLMNANCFEWLPVWKTLENSKVNLIVLEFDSKLTGEIKVSLDNLALTNVPVCLSMSSIQNRNFFLIWNNLLYLKLPHF